MYGGNYGSYVKTRQENEVNQGKKYDKEQDDIKHLQEFIRSCGTYSNMVKQAQSKQKIIDKMVEAGLTPKVVPDPVFRFSFPNSPKLAPPVMAFQKVAFAYSGKKEDYLYTDLDFGIDCDSRIALVGPNGAGKSTLLKLMTLELEPTEGDVRKNPHLRIGRYNQHSEDVLDLEKNPLDFMRDKYPDGIVTADGKNKLHYWFVECECGNAPAPAIWPYMSQPGEAGDVSDVLFDNITLRGTNAGLAMKSLPPFGGRATNAKAPSTGGARTAYDGTQAGRAVAPTSRLSRQDPSAAKINSSICSTISSATAFRIKSPMPGVCTRYNAPYQASTQQMQSRMIWRETPQAVLAGPHSMRRTLYNVMPALSTEPTIVKVRTSSAMMHSNTPWGQSRSCMPA